MVDLEFMGLHRTYQYLHYTLYTMSLPFFYRASLSSDWTCRHWETKKQTINFPKIELINGIYSRWDGWVEGNFEIYKHCVSIPLRATNNFLDIGKKDILRRFGQMLPFESFLLFGYHIHTLQEFASNCKISLYQTLFFFIPRYDIGWLKLPLG